jgi:mannitol/fructose-specific phosphotransferase system IIA component (Ntr-type)
VAVPHAKHESIEKLVAALGISRRGVEFESLDGRPARAIFLLLARVDNPGPHVRALAEIARLVETPHFMDKLLGAKTPAEVLHIIRSEE